MDNQPETPERVGTGARRTPERERDGSDSLWMDGLNQRDVRSWTDSCDEFRKRWRENE